MSIEISEHALDLLENLRVCNEEYVYLKYKGGDEGRSELASIIIQKYIADLEAESAALKSQVGKYRWHNIEVDGLPDRDYFYLALENNNQVAGYYSWSKNSGWSDGERTDIRTVTHWMELPALPEEAVL